MARARLIKNTDGTVYGVQFDCPACIAAMGDVFFGRHTVPVPPTEHAWNFNGDLDHPTLTPSVDLRSHGVMLDAGPAIAPRCHSIVTSGRIAYQPDCTHTMAGQTVDLPEVDA